MVKEKILSSIKIGSLDPGKFDFGDNPLFGVFDHTVAFDPAVFVKLHHAPIFQIEDDIDSSVVYITG